MAIQVHVEDNIWEDLKISMLFSDEIDLISEIETLRKLNPEAKYRLVSIVW